MNKLDEMLKNTPTLKVYEKINEMLIEIIEQKEKREFVTLDYKEDWWFSNIEGIDLRLNELEVIFKRDMKGNYYFNMSKYPFYSFGDYGLKTCYFTKNDYHYIDLSEASIIKEIGKNIVKAKENLIFLTKDLVKEKPDPIKKIRKIRLKSLFN